MKPFSLEEALAGKPVLLRNGDEAYIRHFESELKVTAEARVVGYSEGGLLLSWCPEGLYNHELREPHHWDIVGMYPETRVINGYEVPAPEAGPLEEGCTYVLAMPHAESLHMVRIWEHINIERLWLSRGLIFLRREDAIANAKAMLGIDPNTGD